MATCISLLSRHHTVTLFNLVLSSEGKCIPYNTLKRSKHRLSRQDADQHSVKSPMHPRKIMIFVWCTARQEVDCELLPKGQMLTKDLCSKQLVRVQQALQQKEQALLNRKDVLFFHDNARSHVTRVVRRSYAILLTHLTLHHPITTTTTPEQSSSLEIFAPRSHGHVASQSLSFTARGLHRLRYVDKS